MGDPKVNHPQLFHGRSPAIGKLGDGLLRVGSATSMDEGHGHMAHLRCLPAAMGSLRWPLGASQWSGVTPLATSPSYQLTQTRRDSSRSKAGGQKIQRICLIEKSTRNYNTPAETNMDLPNLAIEN